VSLWWDYYRPHALALFRCEGTSEESHARRVMRWLRADGRAVISREDVRRSALREAVDAREADHVIACLVEGGVLRPRPRASTGRAGRPALRWDVNPFIAGSAPLRGAHGVSNEEKSATEWCAPSKDTGAIFSSLDDDARLGSHAPSDDTSPSRANRANLGNQPTH
jgi:hypothetical protein